MRILAGAVASLMAVGAAHAEDAVTGGAMEKLAATVPERPYYPGDYRDLRIAAAAQAETFPRARSDMLVSFDETAPFYDVIDCNAESFYGPDLSEEAMRRGTLALQVAQLNAELKRLGYRPEVYGEPLEAYERERLAAMSANPTEEDESLDSRLLETFARETEARRARLQPRQPAIAIEGGCGAGESAFLVRTQPANGRVWLINAFAFHVCARKTPDPWNISACRWVETAPDDATMASGRYVYQVRWPDGTTRRGTRVLQGQTDSDEPTPIVLRR